MHRLPLLRGARGLVALRGVQPLPRTGLARWIVPLVGAGAVGSVSEGNQDLAERVAALERRVAELEAGVAPRLGPPPLRRRWMPLPSPLARLTDATVAEAESEDVLGKVGIGLLLVGVLFLLKYTIDRELLTPAVRVAGAAVIGCALLVMGQRLRERRRVLGRLLAGGGVAALFGSLWTASVLFPLLPPAVALVGMAGVAGISLALAIRERDAALSIVGTAGALMTPLLLYRDPGQMAMLTAYMALVVGGAGWVYSRHDWAGLLGIGAAGAWSVLLVAWLVGVRTEAAGTADRVAFTFAVLVTWVVTGVLPVARLAARGREAASTILRIEPAAVLLAPVLACAFLGAAWAWSAAAAAAVLVGLAVVYAVAARRMRATPAAFEALVLAGGLLAAWAAARWFGVFDARALGMIVALSCAVVHLGRREGIPELRALGHLAALGSAGAVVIEQYLAPGGFFSPLERLDGGGALREAIGAAIAAGALAWIGFSSARGSTARYAYLTAAHMVVVLLTRTLLLPLPGGAAITSTTWAVYAIALVAIGLRSHDDVLRQIGLGTVLVTVAKVLVFDLSAIPTLWRVLLFMGLGTLMLLVSYYVPALVRVKRRGGDAGGSVGGEGVGGVEGDDGSPREDTP